MQQSVMKKKAKRAQYQSLYKKVQDLKEQIDSSKKVMKNLENNKVPNNLEQAKYSPIKEGGSIRVNKINKQLSISSLDYANQQIFENFVNHTPQPRLSSIRLRSIQSMASAKCTTSVLKEIKVLPKLDIDQVQSFMNNFTIEKQTRKRSKYETIMNRLRQKYVEEDVQKQQINTQHVITRISEIKSEELNIPNMLKALTPSYETYKQQRDALNGYDDKDYDVKQKVFIKKKIIVPKMIKKLGLIPFQQKKEQFVRDLEIMINDNQNLCLKQQLTQEIKVSNESFITQNKIAKIMKTEPSYPNIEGRMKYNSYKSSMEAMKTQQQMFDDYLQVSDVQSLYYCPTNHKQLMTTKHKIKDFYNEICSYSHSSHYDQVNNKKKVKEHMGDINNNIQTWQQRMLSQNEKMELNLLSDIKDQVIMNKKGVNI